MFLSTTEIIVILALIVAGLISSYHKFFLSQSQVIHEVTEEKEKVRVFGGKLIEFNSIQSSY